MLRNPVSNLFVAISIMAGLFISGSYYYLHHTSSDKESADIIIEKGQSVAEIAEDLAQSEIISAPSFFAVLAYLNGGSLKAGEYNFNKGITPAEVIKKLKRGDVVIHTITIPEGLANYQIKQLLRQHQHLKGKITIDFAEGSLHPETYQFTKGHTRNQLIQRMITKQAEILQKLWDDRDDDLPLKSPEEALILASIVEKETSVDDERARVAGVFINRLNKGMKLQSDPTVIYPLSRKKGVLDRKLYRKDLRITSPYNTYRNKGLPPTPIANPGEKSIEAVLNPDYHDELYFVASGNGGHLFAKTLKEHNRNVRKYKQVMRER